LLYTARSSTETIRLPAVVFKIVDVREPNNLRLDKSVPIFGVVAQAFQDYQDCYSIGSCSEFRYDVWILGRLCVHSKTLWKLLPCSRRSSDSVYGVYFGYVLSSRTSCSRMIPTTHDTISYIHSNSLGSVSPRFVMPHKSNYPCRRFVIPELYGVRRVNLDHFAVPCFKSVMECAFIGVLSYR
jgi:hypothetical protein